MRMEESGWLIEKRGNIPEWFALSDELEDGCGWVVNASDALRFARKEDAEAYINHIGWTACFASEHGWG